MQTSGDLYVDELLSRLAARHTNHSFIAQQIFQPIQVSKSSGRFYVFGKKHLKVHDLRLAQYGKSQEAGFKILGTQTYTVDSYAVKDFVDDEDRQNTMGTAVDPEQDTAIAVTEMVLLVLEDQLQTKLRATANYDTNYSETLAGTDQWSDYTGSNPITKVRDGVRQIHGGGVPGPFSMVIGKQAYDVLIDHPLITDRIKYTSSESIGPDVLARIFDLRRVLVGEAVENTAAEGASDSMSYLWADDVILFADPVAPGVKQATFGRIFYDSVFGGNPVVVRRWQDTERPGNVTAIEALGRWTPEFVALDDLTDKDSVGGYLIKDTVA